MITTKKLTPAELARWEADRRRDLELRAQYNARPAPPCDETGPHIKGSPNGKQFERMQARLSKAAKKKPKHTVKAGLVARPTDRLGATVILDVTVKDHWERSEILLAKAQKKPTAEELKANPKGAGRKFELDNDLLVIEAARQLGRSVSDCPTLIDRVADISPDTKSLSAAKSRIRAAVDLDETTHKKRSKISKNP